jgi:hypothetical protein
MYVHYIVPWTVCGKNPLNHRKVDVYHLRQIEGAFLPPKRGESFWEIRSQQCEAPTHQAVVGGTALYHANLDAELGQAFC